jgi:hypothetical protein
MGRGLRHRARFGEGPHRYSDAICHLSLPQIALHAPYSAVDAWPDGRITSGVPAKPSTLVGRPEYELIYRFFERTLIHERRYIYTGKEEHSLAFAHFSEATHHYFANQLENIRHFGLPKSKSGSFLIADFGLNRTGIYMDDLRLCPDCGTFFVSDAPYLFDAIKEQQKPFPVAISALINARTQTPEFVVCACDATPECAVRCREQRPREPSYEKELLSISQQLRSRRHKSVYLIQAGTAYKIGITSNIHARISALQPACPHKITLIKSWKPKDPRGCEKLLHARFRDYHLQNEWFELPVNVVTNLTATGSLALTRWLDIRGRMRLTRPAEAA